MNDNPNRLKELRKSKRLTQERLANEFNVTQAMISLYERKGNIPYDMLATIANFFGVSVDYLLNISDEKYQNVPKYITEPENRLLTLYRALPFNKRKLIDEMVQVILSEQI